MFEVGSNLVIANEESDSFEQVSSWAKYDPATLTPITGQFLCSFTCSAARVVTEMPSEEPSMGPTVSPIASDPTTSPIQNPSAIPSQEPTVSPSTSIPTVSPSGIPTSAPVSTLNPTDMPTVAPTEVCVVFTLTCESGEFGGMYSRANGWKTQYISDNGFTFETGFIFNEIRWVFQGPTSSSILVSEYFENGFDRIDRWSLVDSNFMSSSNACSIDCSSSGSPTASPTAFPTTISPTEAPATAIPTNMPSLMPSTMPTDAPVTSEPTNVPTVAPSASSPTQSPSLAPTTPCLVFSLECSSNVFDGVYSYDAWQRAWIEQTTGDEFSVTISQAGLQWIFESVSNPGILVSNRYEHDFSSIPSWTMQNRFDTGKGEAVECAFECSASYYPSSAPSVSTTLQPSSSPSTSAPTQKQKHIFVLENHISGRSTLNDAEQAGWVNAMTQVLNGPDEITIINMSPITVEQRRSLALPELNVTAEVVFYSELERDTQQAQLMDDSQQTNLNTLLGIMFMMNGMPGAQSEFVGLVGSFNGAYYQPSNMPTEMPSVYKAKATPTPSLMPTISSGTVITVVIDGVDPDDDNVGDEIKNVTDTVTGEDTTIISITENPDGTVTVTVGCLSCDDNDNDQIADDVSNELNDEFAVVSVDSSSRGGAKTGDDSVIAEVATSGTMWMMVALAIGGVLILYFSYINRRTIKNRFQTCMLCKQKDQILEVPEGFDFEIAAPNKDFMRGFPRINSASSAWTQRTAATFVEGDETNYNYKSDDEFEGNETIDVMPANVQDGWEETMPDDFDDDVSETAESYGGAVTMPHRGENTIRVSDDVYSRPTFETNGMNGEGPYSPSSVAYETDVDSPTAVSYDRKRALTYETDIDSPTAVSYAPKRGPQSISSYASTPTAYKFNEFNSQDLSGFANLSPSASTQGRFFAKRGIQKDQSLQTEQLERDWVVAQNARLRNEKKMLQSFSTRSLNLSEWWENN